MPGSFKKLQIRQITNSGEVINTVDCFGGQLSVFRASSDEALKPYQRALSGTPGAERFIIELDGEPFEPSQHSLVGFGETFIGQPGSPAVFLLSNGVPAASIDALLMAHGLELVGHGPMGQLTRCQERRVRLLAATYSHGKILIANDPLEPLASEWREKFAEILVSYARNTPQLVVVTCSSFRPRYWIDNDSVARVQVGEHVDKTIGFKTGQRRATAILNQFRDMLKHDNSLSHLMKTIEDTTAGKRPEFSQPEADHGPGRAKTYAPLTSFQEAERRPRGSGYRTAALVMVAVVVTAVATVAFGGRIINRDEIAAIVAAIKPAPWPQTPANEGKPAPAPAGRSEPAQGAPTEAAARAEAPENEPATDARAAEKAAPEAPKAEVVTVALALDRYPPEIKSSIIATFDGSAVPPPKQAESSRPAKSGGGKSSQTSDLLRSLESASDTGDSSPSLNAPSASRSVQIGQAPLDSAPQSNYTQEIINAAIEAAPEPDDVDDEPIDTGAEQQKREQIRQKFLDAIDRAARRQPPQ